jgi:hypothetical protein
LEYLKAVDLFELQDLIYMLQKAQLVEFGLQIMSRGHNAGQGHNIKGVHSSSENMPKLEKSGLAFTNHYFIYGEIKGRFNLVKTCYHSLQNLLCPGMQNKHVNTEKRRKPVMLHDIFTRSVTLSYYTANCRHVLSSERALHRNKTADLRQEHSDRSLVASPARVLDTKTV